MLRWRLTLGPLIIFALVMLCRADIESTRPGLYFLPVALVLSLLAAQEIINMLRASGKTPLAWTLYLGAFLPTLAACAPIAWFEYPSDCPTGRLGWLACGLAAAMLFALVGEMQQYTKPGNSITNLSSATLSVLYVGGLLGFLVQLRLLPVAGDTAKGGMLAMLSMVTVVKATDIGAYTFGRLFGRHKMAPTLSPGKTWEGAAGGLAFGIAGAMLSLGPMVGWLGLESSRSSLAWVGTAVGYGIVVGVAGIIGDLAESMLKRDSGVKDSSTWLPGFGGVLDLLDSLLVAAPVAYFCWVSGLMGF